jgi:ribonuclease HII
MPHNDDFPREFRKLGFTVHAGTPTREELLALTRAIEKNAHPPTKYRSSWARLKIQNSLPGKWGTTPS